ncbi:phage virion morphogenesis protein [Escherichia coli O25b:H4]|nr:phage virion morphogenesis protein [Escherichia coli]TLH71985.1 phage virion morphogenesis protein [Escherichia coli O25b:H4]
MNEFKRFEDRLTGLIESLSPSGRRRLSAELAKRLRQSQQRRVMAQKAPDGTPYVPRQQQSARKKRPVALSEKCLRNLSPVVFCISAPARSRHQWNFYGGKSPKIASVHQFVCRKKTGKTVRKLIIRRVSARLYR